MEPAITVTETITHTQRNRQETWLINKQKREEVKERSLTRLASGSRQVCELWESDTASGHTTIDDLLMLRALLDVAAATILSPKSWEEANEREEAEGLDFLWFRLVEEEGESLREAIMAMLVAIVTQFTWFSECSVEKEGEVADIWWVLGNCCAVPSKTEELYANWPFPHYNPLLSIL